MAAPGQSGERFGGDRTERQRIAGFAKYLRCHCAITGACRIDKSRKHDRVTRNITLGLSYFGELAANAEEKQSPLGAANVGAAAPRSLSP